MTSTLRWPATVTAAVLVVDQATKLLAGDVVHNYGTAAHLDGVGYAQALAATGAVTDLIGVAVAVVLLVIACVRPMTLDARAGWALIASAGVGNCLDRLRVGAVIDWMPVGDYSANIADVAGLLGMLLVLVSCRRGPLASLGIVTSARPVTLAT